MFFDLSFDKNSPKHIRVTNVKLSTEIEVVEVGYNRVPAGKEHLLIRDVYILHYVISGKGMFQGIPFDRDCIYVTVPGEREHVVADEKEPYETCWIMFRGTLAHKMLGKCKIPYKCGVCKFDRNIECAELIKKTVYADYSENDMAEAFDLQSTFYKLIAQHMLSVGSDDDRNDSIARDIAAFLEKNYHWDVKIDSIAEMFNYSRNHLYTLFKKEYGISPKEYLLDLRIEKAKQILSENGDGISVKETAYAVGFGDPLYFSRVFRSVVGVSPMQYKSNSNNKL